MTVGELRALLANPDQSAEIEFFTGSTLKEGVRWPIRDLIISDGICLTNIKPKRKPTAG